MRFSAASKRALAACAWPGNIRELENVVERAVNLAEGTIIETQLLGGIAEAKEAAESSGRSRSYLAEVEKRAIRDVLETEAFNISRAADTLGITRATLYRKIKKYGLEVPIRMVG
jgi:DNA-binding NtrC family response regulator